MNWAFIKDILFYSFLGLISFVPLVIAVASLRNQSFRNARKETLGFLESWAKLASGDWLKTVFKVAGLSGVLVLLGFVAYGFNRLGDVTMPYTSQMVEHFGNRVVQWTIDNERDWDRVKFEFREVSGIRGDRQQWEKVKGELGVHDIRLFRVLFFLFLLISVAGLVDTIGSRNLRRRGLFLFFLGMIGLAASQWLWIDRTKQYVINFVARYESTHLQKAGQKPLLPESYVRMIEGKGH